MLIILKKPDSVQSGKHEPYSYPFPVLDDAQLTILQNANVQNEFRTQFSRQKSIQSNTKNQASRLKCSRVPRASKSTNEAYLGSDWHRSPWLRTIRQDHQPRPTHRPQFPQTANRRAMKCISNQKTPRIINPTPIAKIKQNKTRPQRRNLKIKSRRDKGRKTWGK